MILKKSKVSNLIWIIYSIFAMAFSAMVFTKAAETLGFDDGLGLIAVPVVLVFGIGIVILAEQVKKVLKKKIKKQIVINKKISVLIPYIICLILFGVGLFLRIRQFQAGNYDLREYYSNSIITQAPMVNSVHGASQFYYFSVRNIFMLFGNHYEAALIFQIVCQMLSVIVLFFVGKRMLGNVHAVVITSFFTLAPCMISESLTLGPSVLYMLYISLDILLLSYAVPFRKLSYIIAAITGTFSALIIYMDSSSIVLLAMLVLFYLGCNKAIADDGQNKKASRAENISSIQDKTVAVIIFVGCCLAALLICEIIDLAVSGLTLSAVVKAQISNYLPGEFSLYTLYSGIDVISGAVMSVLLLIGIPAGFFRKESDQGCVPFAVAILLSLIYGFTISDASMNGYSYIFMTLSFIVAETVYAVLFIHEGASSVVRVLDEEEALLLEAERIKKLKSTVHKIEDGEMLANPLPVPEKKKKKKMEYEYFVPDDAEYDI